MEIIGFYREGEEFGCFSNWYPAEFDYAGKHYSTSEQFMMYQKVLLFGQFDLAEQIMKAGDPETCKILGQSFIPEFDISLWKKMRYPIVKRGVRAKFAQNPDILEVLLKTGNCILAECAPRDADWGIKVPISDPAYQDIKKWNGDNLLGRMLMEIRDELRTAVQLAGAKNFDWSGENRSNGFPAGDVADVDLPRLPYKDACELAPIPEWKTRAGDLFRIPKYHTTIKAYADVLGRGFGLPEGGSVANKKTFFFSRTLAEWEQALRAGDCGIPGAGFFELKQDIYDIARG